MERPRASTIAISALGVGITAYELLCADEELITNRTAEWLDNPRTRLLTASFIGATALHLLGRLDSRIDPYSHAGRLRRYTRPEVIDSPHTL